MADVIEGEGKFYTLNGEIINGIWKNNKLFKKFWLLNCKLIFYEFDEILKPWSFNIIPYKGEIMVWFRVTRRIIPPSKWYEIWFTIEVSPSIPLSFIRKILKYRIILHSNISFCFLIIIFTPPFYIKIIFL